MAKLESLGKVIETDVLVIGGGMSGAYDPGETRVGNLLSICHPEWAKARPRMHYDVQVPQTTTHESIHEYLLTKEINEFLPCSVPEN